MSLKRIGITALAVLALALTGIGARAQVVLLPGYGSYGGYLPLGGGLGSPYGAYNPFWMGYGNAAYNGYQNLYGYQNPYGTQNPDLYNGPAGYGYYGPYDVNAADVNGGYGYYGGYNQTAIPRTNDSVMVRKQANNKVYMSWQGDPAMVSSITFALLDRNGTVLTQRTITSPPAEMTFKRTSRSAYSQIVIHYINGTTNTFAAPL
ncbi:MAG TPA: hypothetical protein VFA07_18245 [Chthonomonadaceae bacterium]|nr:hypothetical protein [Chthonomonadaceae bacterium]